MEILEAILATIHFTSGKATRTVIQKLCYFLKVNGIIDVEFRPYYYGPHSDDVQESLLSLIRMGFIDEIAGKYENASFRWKRRKYTYNITEDGKILLDEQENTFEYKEIEDIVEKCRKFAGFNLDILSTAAKIHYVLIKNKERCLRTTSLKKRRGRGGR